jgi:hypothetical protein
MRHMTRALGPLTLLALAACAGGGVSSPGPSPAPSVGAASAPSQLSVTMGQQFSLRVGQAASVAGVSSVVTFRGVRSDSRCPDGVQCVQAGNAEVVLGVATGGAAPAEVLLNTTATPRERTLGNGILRLIALAPARTAQGTIDPGAYVATLCVCRQ